MHYTSLYMTMEEGYTLLLQTIVVESSKMKVDPTSPPQLDINLKFLFQISSNNNWIIEQDSIHIKQTPVLTEKLISLNLRQFSDYKGTCEILHELLIDWRVLDSTREIVVDFVWSITRTEILSMVRAHDEIRVSLQFDLKTVTSMNAIDEGDAHAATYVMVSSTGTSIELLEKKMVEEGERCPICLDVLCDGVSMPCFHVFHGDCIKTWFDRSQCCPLCRLEMPIPKWIY